MERAAQEREEALRMEEIRLKKREQELRAELAKSKLEVVAAPALGDV